MKQQYAIITKAILQNG